MASSGPKTKESLFPGGEPSPRVDHDKEEIPRERPQPLSEGDRRQADDERTPVGGGMEMGLGGAPVSSGD